jgi:hypothetical protein
MLYPSIACLAGILALVPVAQAATIVAAGSVLDEPNWYTAGYGGLGYVFFGDNNATPVRGGILHSVTGTVSLADLSTADENAQTGTVALENPAGGTFSPGTWFDFGLTDDNLHDIASITFQAGSPSRVRIGLAIGASVAATAGTTADFPQQVAVGAVSQAVAKPLTAIARADWYFFDVTGITEGETLTISASRIGDITSHRFNPVSGIVIQVPEPGIAGLATLGLLGVLRRRRQHG